MENTVIVHWGIKGMKWGQRRFQNKDGSLTPAGKKRYEKEMEKLTAEKKKLRNQERTKAKLDKLKAVQDEVEARKKALQEDKPEKTPKPEKHTKREIKEMSNEDIKKLIDRLDIERKLVKAETSRGREFVVDILEKSGKNIGTQLVTYALGTAANKFFAELAGDPTIINPKKGQKEK